MAARTPPSDLMRQSDAARALGVKPPTITTYIDNGSLTVEAVAGVRFVTRASVERLQRRRAAIAQAKAAP